MRFNVDNPMRIIEGRGGMSQNRIKMLKGEMRRRVKPSDDLGTFPDGFVTPEGFMTFPDGLSHIDRQKLANAFGMSDEEMLDFIEVNKRAVLMRRRELAANRIVKGPLPN
jgi:hypothetical protein